ncbi:hypothetical protein PXK00_01640 [Phaeobacter sp. QD34_3]|uniref:hypothetical protein n=1 Tax=unclassified Phaeobacter TaxID=2621772 RepID=UPI00237F6AA4|nr:MULTISPECIES: hypothetical protein [unclassified Phaeobacter]MDE4131795.1 hypothetical protein [Phaeobacter sp. QD34_3]MDE4175047.1 hypothetical protein [Phaeobacter sp. PT47_59]
MILDTMRQEDLDLTTVLTLQNCGDEWVLEKCKSKKQDRKADRPCGLVKLSG